MMIAANPLPSSDSAADKKPYEPSMEEILASIRRIIADDQSLPGRGAPQVSAPTPIARDQRRSIPPSSPVEPIPAQARNPGDGNERPPENQGQSVASDVQATLMPPPGPRFESGLAHGSIAAPQFATPAGPIGEEPVREAPASLEEPPPAPVSVSTTPPRHDALVHAETEADPMDGGPVQDAPIEPVPPRQVPQDRPELFSAATDSAVSAAFNMLAASRLADNSDELMTLAREMIRPLLRSWIDDNLPSMVERMVRAEIERVARGGR